MQKRIWLNCYLKCQSGRDFLNCIGKAEERTSLFSLCSSKLKVVNQKHVTPKCPICLSSGGKIAIKQKTWMIQQGCRCSMLCCNTTLTVTEGLDGKYCINSSARCFLGFADRVVQGRCNLFLWRPDKALCSGPLSFSTEAVDNTVSHPLPKSCFPNL